MPSTVKVSRSGRPGSTENVSFVSKLPMQTPLWLKTLEPMLKPCILTFAFTPNE